MSRQRSKGTEWETELLPILRSLFGEQVERAPLKGIHDRGDFLGTPFLIEAKNHLVPHFQEWARTCEKKADAWWIVWHGDRRKGAGQGPYVLMPLAEAERLVRSQAF